MSEFENRSNVPVALVTPKVLARTATLRRMILIAVLLYPLGLALHLNLIEPQRHTMAIDFVAFWAAAKLAVQGVAITAFDFPTLQAAELLPDSAADARFTWLYPPAYHMRYARGS